MKGKIYLKRYRLRVDPVGLPFVIRRSANEATFQGDDLKSGEQIAVQIMPAAVWRTSDREQLEREAEAAREINHINVPVLRDFGFEGDQLVCVTEYFDGTTAEDWVKTKGPMPASVALRIAAQAVSALGAAIFHGVVHHAICPGNIMLVPGETPEGEWPLIKLLNFLAVTPSPSALTFASPEQIEKDAVDFRSQIYSLGGTLLFLLTGTPPLKPSSGGIEAAGLAVPLRRLLRTMLANDPDERPADPLVFGQQIQECLAQLERRDSGASRISAGAVSIAPAPELAVEAIPRSSGPWKSVALAAIFVALAAVAAVVFLQRAPQRQALGVPVGIPEASAPPAQIESVNPAIEASDPPVLTSTAVASEEETSALPSDAETAEAEQEVVANEPPAPELSPPLVAENDAETPSEPEPAPPTEGPDDEIAPRSPTPVEVAPPVVAAKTETGEPLAPIPTVAPAPEKSATPVTIAKRAIKKEQPSAERMKYLGRTAEGNLLFGLAPNERIYAPSPPPLSREERRRSRHAARPVKELPVLPALPPDE